MQLDQINCASLTGVGPKTLEKLTKIGIHNIQDLLFYLPFRYVDRTKITPMRFLQIGEHALIEGKITAVNTSPTKRRNLLCTLRDNTGNFTIRFLHFPYRSQFNIFQIGKIMRCFGEVRFGQHGLEMIHPEYQIFSQDKILPLEQTLSPVYPTINGLSQTTLRKSINQALILLKKYPLSEYLPEPILHKYSFPKLDDAIIYLHKPEVNAPLELIKNYKHPAQLRLIFEELLSHFLCLKKLRVNLQTFNSPAIPSSINLLPIFLKNLPFRLTNAQNKVIKEVEFDLAQSKPMLRLLQGDVGSGKTVIAVSAALQAVENAWQVAIMAPTEILAEQHYQNLLTWLKPLHISISLLTGKTPTKNRAVILKSINNGETKIIIGTHALFQKDISFANLALVIIDEQHRFGVHQRLALREKGLLGKLVPHQLIMTATPIPRTIAMLAYADLDCSIINELPKGRLPITTALISSQKRSLVLKRVAEECNKGNQVFWICPLISESDKLSCEAAEVTYHNLTNSLPNLSVALLHGQLSPLEKQKTMSAFKHGKINLLVATTVIEVGIDVANANVMIIENPERLGLAQLHQLRGRVGRGTNQSYCILMYKSPLSIIAKQRLAFFRETYDGFTLATKDLELRGPGELLGTEQSGLLKMKIADIIRDQHLLLNVKEAASLLLQHSHDTDRLLTRWVGHREKYGVV